MQDSDEKEVRLFELSKKYSMTYPWLYYNFSKGGYLCKICETFGVKYSSAVSNNSNETPFVDLAVNWASGGGHPKRKLDKHGNSNRHKSALDKQLGYMSTKHKGTVLQQIKSVIAERNSLGRRLRNLTDMDKFDMDVFMNRTLKPLINDLINEIKEAMQVEPVLQAFGVLDPRNLPDNIEDLLGYGEADISVLSNHYGTAFRGHYQKAQKNGNSNY
ncbi:unnamed protein product [Mytilus edulis]|uniref:Uncharacterized protein n=1 Tax=Mytilus edulis TaxID=6550 RepID=A0A8S3TW91_MYTED|nr:unnamed protein product [Mytilus edulis]